MIDRITEQPFCQTRVSGSTFVNADCFDVFPSIPDKSIDAIICDLPYGTTQNKWDSILPLDKLWEQYNRVLKENGVIVLFSSQPFTSALVMNNPKLFKYEWIWEKAVGSNFAVAKYQPLKEHENILVFSKGKTIYNPIKEERKGSGKARLKNGYKSNGTSTEVYGGLQSNRMGKEYEDLKYPSSVQYFNNRDKDRGMHPTQKPIALYKWCLHRFASVGYKILDTHLGSQSSRISAYKAGLDFTGYELDSEYFEQGNARFNEFVSKYAPADIEPINKQGQIKLF